MEKEFDIELYLRSQCYGYGNLYEDQGLGFPLPAGGYSDIFLNKMDVLEYHTGEPDLRGAHPWKPA